MQLFDCSNVCRINFINRAKFMQVNYFDCFAREIKIFPANIFILSL